MKFHLHQHQHKILVIPDLKQGNGYVLFQNVGYDNLGQYAQFHFHDCEIHEKYL